LTRGAARAPDSKPHRAAARRGFFHFILMPDLGFVAFLCARFMSDHSKVRNKPNTWKGYQGNIDRNIIPSLGGSKSKIPKGLTWPP
jgi:hypothetical protein